MRTPTILLGMLLNWSIAVSALAAFQVTATSPVAVAPGLFEVNLYARNLGDDTGGRLLGAQVQISTSTLAKSLWNYRTPTVPDIRNLFDVPNRSFIRIGTDDLESILTQHSPSPNWPTVNGNDHTVYMPNGGLAYAFSYLGGVPAGQPTLFSKLILTEGFVGSIFGKVGGEVGPATSFGPIVVSVPEPTSMMAAATSIPCLRRRRRIY